MPAGSMKFLFSITLYGLLFDGVSFCNVKMPVTLRLYI